MGTSSNDTELRQLTLRIPKGLHARARKMAKARHTSVNALVRLLLENLDRQERERSLEAVYDSVGRDSGSDVTLFFEAQARLGP